jgi:hypothetical protein
VPDGLKAHEDGWRGSRLRRGHRFQGGRGGGGDRGPGRWLRALGGGFRSSLGARRGEENKGKGRGPRRETLALDHPSRPDPTVDLFVPPDATGNESGLLSSFPYPIPPAKASSDSVQEKLHTRAPRS